MEDLLHPDAGKRKRSPADSLVDVSIPFPPQSSSTSSIPGYRDSTINDEHPSKRLRLPAKPPPPDTGAPSYLGHLPSSILQVVFSYLDPPSLARLVRVNTRFQTLLDSRFPLPRNDSMYLEHKGRVFSAGACSVCPQDTVWTTSRRRHVPSMPKPMDEMSEREFFALVYGAACQICGLRSSLPSARRKDPWRSVPGNPGIHMLWPFKLRSCTHCLAPRLKKDSDVFMSDASPLRPALAFAFFTQSLHFIPLSFCKGSIPSDVTLHKFYYDPEIQNLEKEAKSVQELGSGAVEEWFKGLSSRGQRAQKFVAQMEEWELEGGLEQAQRLLLPGRFEHAGLQGQSSSAQQYRPSTSATSFDDHGGHMIPPGALPVMPLRSHGMAPGLEIPPGLPSKPSDASSMGSQKSNRRYAAAPSSRELARNRAYKKEDIIMRCRALNPPISRDMLERLDAFENALKVSMPLNDNSWETLKDLLLKQKRQLELQDEAKASVRKAPTPGQFTAPSRSDEYVLAHADVSVKEKLSEIAEEYIKQRFGYGAWITYDTAPQFAAEVLIHVRKTYIEDRDRLHALRAQSGILSLSTPQDETLKYEHMKWVFDQTIRPRTEQTRKDLFVCAACPSNGAVKYFAFESMVQHYAFKHDSNLTTEAPKAFWKCEWPEISPFNGHPERLRTPTPSITHTPTLSHKPLSIMSPGSAVSMTIPTGRRTPDTMSLLSNNTNPFSVTAHNSRQQNPVPNAPGSAMYELQRNSVTAEIVRSWTILQTTPSMPVSLRLYLVLGLAVWNFSKRYKNEPPLGLLKDCIRTKAELRELRDIENLRCTECFTYGGDPANTNWALQDLVIHFEKAHLEQSHNGARLDWKNDMIFLPVPAQIKSLLSNGNMPTILIDLLKQAEITATIKHASMIPNKSSSVQSPDRIRSSRQTYNDFDELTPLVPLDIEQIYRPIMYQEDRYEQSRLLPRSTAATYGDHGSSRDAWSASSHTVKAEDASSIGSTRPVLYSPDFYVPHPDTIRSERAMPSVEAIPALHNRRTDVTRAEAMRRSETMRSHRSRGEITSVNTAEDFLSTIDAQLDIEMADSGSGEPRSIRTSQPVSRTNSVREPMTRISVRPSPDPVDGGTMRRLSDDNSYSLRRQELDLLARRGEQQSQIRSADDSPTQPMERQPSRIIEFDRQGNPVPSVGHVYQEVSPPRAAASRQYVDPLGRTMEPSFSSYVRTFPGGAREMTNIQYVEDRYSRPLYEPIPYGTTAYRPERIVDPITGQTYVAERPPARQLIEIDEHLGRPQTTYDTLGRPILYEYRQVQPDAYPIEDARYERFPTEHQDRRYQGR